MSREHATPRLRILRLRVQLDRTATIEEHTASPRQEGERIGETDVLPFC